MAGLGDSLGLATALTLFWAQTSHPGTAGHFLGL